MQFRLVIVLYASASFSTYAPAGAQSQTAPDPAVAALDSVRRTRDESQLNLLKTQLSQRIAENPKEAQAVYHLALVPSDVRDHVFH